MSAALAPHFFRHEYGRLVAMLSRRMGVQHLESVEDAVQSALLSAVEAWSRDTVPDNPSAWLFRTAHNAFIGEQRRRLRHDALDNRHGNAVQAYAEPSPLFLSGEVRDDLLRMLFVCCDPLLPVESQLVLALKTLCGFGIHEIAERLFITDANVYKRLARARSRLREAPFEPGDLTAHELVERLPAVLAVLYLMFTEGYLSSHAQNAIRREMCDEALRLAQILAEHPPSAQPVTFALLALMHLQRSRLSGRQDVHGGLLLLEEQDRSLWNREEINLGLTWLARSARGETFSRYHAEAGIAAEHCLARTFAETRWERIVECYALLEQLAPSPLHSLNRALAMAEWRGPEPALALLEALAPPMWLAGSYLWHAALADLHRRCGHAELAQSHGAAALAQVPSEALRAALARRLGSDSYEVYEMKRLGILGGMGPESTAVYYLDAVRSYRRLFDTRNAPLISIDSLDVVEVLRLIETGERERVVQMLCEGVQRLHAAGASLAIIASNTPHIFFEQVAENSPVAMISIVDATCDEAQRKGCARLGVIGTTPTIRSGIYQDGLQRRGIACFELAPAQQDHLHQIYVQELLFGQVIPRSVENLHEMIATMVRAHGLDAVVLAGTELSLAFPDPGKSTVPFLASGSIHVENALRHLFGLARE